MNRDYAIQLLLKNGKQAFLRDTTTQDITSFPSHAAANRQANSLIEADNRNSKPKYLSINIVPYPRRKLA